LNVVFRASFARDLKRVRNKRLRANVKQIIELVEQVHSLRDIGNLKKLKGGTGYYRVQIGDYRIGLYVEGDTVAFVRCLHRKDIYRYFP